MFDLPNVETKNEHREQAAIKFILMKNRLPIMKVVTKKQQTY